MVGLGTNTGNGTGNPVPAYFRFCMSYFVVGNFTRARFGRDYYVRQASKSAGAKKAFDQDNDQANIQFPWIGAEETENNSDEMKNELLPTSKNPEIVNYSAPNHDVVVKSVPFFIKTTSSLQLTARPKNLDFSSDSDLSVGRVYNLQTGTVIEKIVDFTREVINGGNTPECVKCIQKEFDQNHNNNESSNFNETTENKKREFLRSLTQSDDDSISPVDLPSNYLNAFNDETFDVSHSTLQNEINPFNNEEVQAVSIQLAKKNSKMVIFAPANHNIKPHFINKKDEKSVDHGKPTASKAPVLITRSTQRTPKNL